MGIASSPNWLAVQAHARRLAATSLRELFAGDSERASRLSRQVAGLHVDFSKQRIDAAALDALLELARAAGVEGWRDAMMAGEAINRSENRAVLHVALRHRGEIFPCAANNVMPAVRAELARMGETAKRIREGRWLGLTGQPIRHVVNIGIGGSDLGPKMVTQALQALGHPAVCVHYISNLDGAALAPLLALLDPRTTLFIVASKTFVTQETLTNAGTAKQWLINNLGEANAEAAVSKHFLAISAAPDRAASFGIAYENTFRMWDWVGGRYSLWSAVGLPLMIEVGPQVFDELLAGAAAMDKIFCESPLEDNLPVLMALVGIWNTNFLGAETLAVLPYSESLSHLPAYLQQLEMESNGKTVGRDGETLDCKTNPIVWGEIGINGQHAFFQLLHQGGRLIPADFIAAIHADFPLPGHHDAVLANCFAQSAALAFGRNAGEARADLESSGHPPAEVERLLPHKIFPGNQPSTTVLLSALAPQQIGALLALYEHKVFVQGVIWGTNPFDQWGVELGKSIARQILPELSEKKAGAETEPAATLDASTRALLDYVRTSTGR